MCDSPAEVLSDAVDTGRGFAEDAYNLQQDVYNKVYNIYEDTYNSIEDESVNFYKSTYYIASGEKDRDQRRLSDKGNDLNNIASQLTAMQDRLGNKVFLEQIFKYGDIRRIKELGTTYENLVKEYEQLLSDYKNNTDLSFISSVMLFTTNVVAALVYNILDYIKTGDSASLRTAITIGLLIAAIVISVLALIPSGGSSSATLATSIAAIITIMSAILTLDAMVNNSGLLGGVFQILDAVLNKILHFDSFLHTEGFDSDSQYYQSMMNNTRLAIQIAAVIANVYNLLTSPPTASLTTAAGRMAARNADFGAYAGGVASGQTITMQTSAGISGTASSSGAIGKLQEIGSYKIANTASLSDIYGAYNQASQANDIYGALILHAELGRKLEDARDAMQQKISKDNRRKMEGSYRDVEYLMTPADELYHGYVLQISESGNTDYFDPESTIVMNTRFRPKLSNIFGIEDMFQYQNMAGGERYMIHQMWA